MKKEDLHEENIADILAWNAGIQTMNFLRFQLRISQFMTQVSALYSCFLFRSYFSAFRNTETKKLVTSFHNFNARFTGLYCKRWIERLHNFKYGGMGWRILPALKIIITIIVCMGILKINIWTLFTNFVSKEIKMIYVILLWRRE